MITHGISSPRCATSPQRSRVKHMQTYVPSSRSRPWWVCTPSARYLILVSAGHLPPDLDWGLETGLQFRMTVTGFGVGVRYGAHVRDGDLRRADVPPRGGADVLHSGPCR